MKKSLVVLTAIILFIGCSPVKTTMSGLENVSYLELYGPHSKYKNNTTVVIDNSAPFTAIVNKNENNMNPKRYKIPVGKHDIRIYCNNIEILTETIFTSSQITKKIILP